jgi:hypothetical protein
MQRSVLSRPEARLSGTWWLDAGYRGGVEKRVGWMDFEIEWYVVCFRDGTRGPVTYATHNDPEGWIGTRYGK